MLFEAVIGCDSLDFCRLWLTLYWLAGPLTAVRGEWLKRGLHCPKLVCPPRFHAGSSEKRLMCRSVPIPERLVPILQRRIQGRTAGEPAITSPKGSRLGIENRKRAVGWRTSIAELGRPTMRVHDLRHTYASLARSAGADMKLLQVTMGHASIMVTAHTYADLYDSDLDRVADALDGL
jgi:Phage integrase family